LHINQEDFKTIVWRQKNRTPGIDGITAKIIRAVWPVIGDPLLRLINGCLKSKIFSKCWKNAKVVIILKHKDKDPLKTKSYRPISLLPVLGMIYEEVICNLLEADIGNQLSPKQHCFRPGKSTNTALHDLISWIDERDEHVMGIFLDISGAFNNVR